MHWPVCYRLHAVELNQAQGRYHFDITNVPLTWNHQFLYSMN